MLLFAHAGITLGVALLSAGALGKCGAIPQKTGEVGKVKKPLPETASPPGSSVNKHSSTWLNSITTFIDMRIVLLGSLLPDIADKPIGVYLFPAMFDSGRIFFHTLLFALLITLTGIYLVKRYHKTWPLGLSFGVCMHLVLDSMWKSPRTLLWPLFGPIFEPAYLENWLGTIVHRLFRDPTVFIPELVGLAVLIWFLLVLVHKKKFINFLRYGAA